MTGIGLKRGTVALMPHDPRWAEEFEREKRVLLETFGDRILAIEHIGSTSIPGIPAKPLIDILVAVESLDDIDDFIGTLPTLGYQYMPERRFADRQFFPKGPESKRTHHLSLVEPDSETGWNSHTLFRDYLRTHEAERAEYARLKERLAAEFADDRERYTDGKQDFVLEIIAKAKAEKQRDT